jgi:hypothetical protein
MGYLSEVTRRRIAAVLLVLGGIVAVLAIADVGPFENPPTEQEKAQAAVERFFGEAREKRFRAACSELSPERLALIEQAGARIASEKGLEGCSQIFAAVIGDQLAKLKILEVADVRISGNRAAVDLKLHIPGEKHPDERTIDLVLIKDEWRINDLGS